MKITGMMIVGPNEKWLKPVLEQRKQLVDDMIICGNNTDVESEKLIQSYGFWYYRDDREWGKYQPVIKADLLNRVARLKPDWVLPSDADELFDSMFTRAEAERLASTNAIGYEFPIINLWNDEQHYRHDASFWNVRFFRLTPEFGLYFERKNLHCGWAPPYVYAHAWHAPFMVKHYGLMLSEDRQRKHERYVKYDPSAIFKGKEYYNKLTDSGGNVIPFDEDKMRLRIDEDVRKNFNSEYNKVWWSSKDQ